MSLLFAAGLLGNSLSGCHDGGGDPDGDEPIIDARSKPVAVASDEPPENLSDAGAPPSFVVVGAESGLDFERFDDISGRRRILETNGGGAGLIDYECDGLLDVFLTNGCKLPREPDDRRTPSALFRNIDGMRFQRVSPQADLLQYGYSYGCTVGDFNADGFDDVYVTRLGDNALWANNGDGTFVDVTDAAGAGVPDWSSSAAFADVNRDGRLDLYVVNYLDESDDPPTLCPNPASPDGYQGCSPALFDGVDDVLLLGSGRESFIDATESSQISGHPGKGLGVVIANLDAAGLPEIYVANDGEANSLFVARRGEAAPEADGSEDAAELVYEERALLSGLALNEQGFAQASMGIAAGDVDSDGSIDLFLTHFFGDTNTLYSNHQGLAFRDTTRAGGLGAPSRMTLGFGTALIDDDNDGHLDLFIANGHVDDRTWKSVSEPYRMPPQFFRNRGDGNFQEVSHRSGDYFQQAWIGRGVAEGDLNRDGKRDLVVSHQLAPSLALQNVSPSEYRSVEIRLVGVASNRNGFGGRVEVIGAEPPMVREVVGGGSFQSASTGEIHLGLAVASSATIRIHWPSGVVDDYPDVPAGRWIAVEGRTLMRAARSPFDQ